VRPVGSWLAGVAATFCVVLGVSGCGSIGEAQQVVDRARLVNDLAGRLSQAGELTYLADYQLSGGGLATIAQAQHPLRAAYTYPGGKLMITPDATTTCTGAACTLTGPPTPGADATTGLLAIVGPRGLVPPTAVVGLLTAASLSANAVISQHDTTIAGVHATCVDVSGVENAPASAFTACITSDGVLGSFHGTLTGTAMTVSLVRYRDTVSADAFDVPAGATVVDKRAGR